MPDIRNFAGAQVSPVQGKIDVALSQFAQAYRNNSMVAAQLFPNVPVMKESDLFWTFGRENQALRENVLRAPGSPAERIAQTLSKNPYNAKDHSLARLITDEERGNFMAGDVEQWATGALMDKILLDQEVRVAALATATANFAATNKVTLAGTSQWSDKTGAGGATNSDPIGDVETGKSQIRQIGQEANTLVISDPVYKALRSNSAIAERFKFVNGGQITLQQIASVFGIERVLLASAVKLDGNNVASFVWGKSALLAYVQPNANFYDASFGKTFTWTQAPGTVGGFSTEIARITPASAKADEVAVHNYYDVKITSAISGYLIDAAVA